METRTRREVDCSDPKNEYPWIIAVHRYYTKAHGPGDGDLFPVHPEAYYVGPDNQRHANRDTVRGWADPFEAVAWMEAHRDSMPIGFGQHPFLCYRGAA